MKLCASRKYFQNIHAKYYDLPLKNVEEDITLSCAWQLKMRIVRFFAGFVSTNNPNLLATACIKLFFEDNECVVRIHMDSGSQEIILWTSTLEDLKTRSHGFPGKMNNKVL